MEAASATLAVDVGGTFTDAVVAGPSGVHTGKTPTTPEDQSIGVIAAAREALANAGVEAAGVGRFVHGMTVTTNALLEQRFARTALLATAGFTDIEELGRQNRASLYRLAERRPEPIVPASLRFAVAERCGPDGVIAPLDEAALRGSLTRCLDAGVESIAVCLLFSFRHPAHELRVRELAAELLPGVHVSLSHETVGTFREYERCATTVADAALAPLLAGYLGRLTARAAEAGLPEPSVMLSSGGSAPAALAAENASWTVLSGPAGGAVGAAAVAARRGERRALGFDMGGTSTDIALVEDGEVGVASAREIAGRPIALPAVDISTVGAGGGSIAWCDAGGAMRVGPRSAGARPGPACYGHGGSEPTVTDANLLLGYLAADSALAGGLNLDRAAAEAAVGRLASELGLGLLETAAGIIRIADLEMLRATSAATVARGIDPRDHALVAFGGAGPLHAASVAAALEIETVICPAACGVLSAWGMTVAGLRRDRSLSVVRSLAQIDGPELEDLERSLLVAAAGDLGVGPGDADAAVAYELRYAGQAFELAVSGQRDQLEDAFHAAHAERFGFNDPDGPVELVTLRVSAELAAAGGGDPSSEPASDQRPARALWFEGVELEARIFAGAPPAGEPIAGPAVIEQPQSTILVPPGWSVAVEGPDIVLRRQEASR